MKSDSIKDDIKGTVNLDAWRAVTESASHFDQSDRLFEVPDLPLILDVVITTGYLQERVSTVPFKDKAAS